MTASEIVVVLVVLFVFIEQALGARSFRHYCRRRLPDPRDTELPEVLVVLALRGCDATLRDCLRSLCQQYYPRYRVRVIVDGRADPAWPVVQQVLQELDARHVEVRPLEHRGTTCTLKCSALLQATADLDPTVDVVAFVDADVVLPRNWLRTLVAPLADDQVEATMGNRWYRPRTPHWGALVRYLWNTSAVLTMYHHQVPWGGSLALKAEVLRDSPLRQLWTRSGCDDVPLYNVLRARRRRLVFVPGVLLLNREECRLAACLRFIGRQLLWLRLYHPWCWWRSAGLHFLKLGGQWAALGLAGRAAVNGAWLAAGTLAGALLLSVCGTFAIGRALELYAATVVPAAARRPRAYWLKLAVAIPLTEVVNALALVMSLGARSVEWRGVRYRIRGPWSIRMVEDLPPGRS